MPDLQNMKPQDLQSLIADGKQILILDVRQKNEYDAGHIDGAVLIPLQALSDRLAELPKDKQIVVYCQMGGRSAQAVALLRQKGFENVANLPCGYAGWPKTPKRESPKKDTKASIKTPRS